MMVFDDDFSDNHPETDCEYRLVEGEDKFNGYGELISYLSEKDSKFNQLISKGKINFEEYGNFEEASKLDYDTTQAEIVKN